MNTAPHLLQNAQLPDEMRQAHLKWTGSTFYPESTAFLEKTRNAPDQSEIIHAAAMEGDIGAMLLLARGLHNAGDDVGSAYWVQLAYDRGSPEAAFTLADEDFGFPIAVRYQMLSKAVDGGLAAASWALANLCREESAENLGITEVTWASSLAKCLEIGDALLEFEMHQALVTGAHPVQFKSEYGIWGSGTFFIATWKGQDFAFTAKHVIDNCNADPAHAQLLVPNHESPVPFLGSFTPRLEDDVDLEETTDIFIWAIDSSSQGPAVSWWSWRMDFLWKPATSLVHRQKLFVIGYPNTDDKFDLHTGKIQRIPLVVRAEFDGSSGIEGLYAIDCAEFSVDIDGISGGPVFTMVGGVFYYVGMAVRGSAAAKRIHFLDAAYILDALEQVSGGSQFIIPVPSPS